MCFSEQIKRMGFLDYDTKMHFYFCILILLKWYDIIRVI